MGITEHPFGRTSCSGANVKGLAAAGQTSPKAFGSEMRSLLFSVLVLMEISKGASLLCYCQGLCPDGRPNGTCTAAPGAGCFASAEEVYDSDTDTLVAERTYGCLPPDDNGGLFACKAGLSRHAAPTAIECCRRGDLCNRALYPMYERRSDDSDGDAKNGSSGDGGDWSFAAVSPAVFHLVLLCTVTVCVVSLVFFVTCLYLKYQRKELARRRQMYRQEQASAGGDCSGSTLQDLLEQTSGTGAGLPLLVQRTIAKQVQMQQKVGQGRYGEVWLARWRGERVAVKVFYTTEEASWFRETEIYQTVLMRHENILGFIAADIRGTGGWSQMLLVTDYHEAGSLQDYLVGHSLHMEASIRLAHSLACGLAHLHTEIFGSRGKPAIAHRDLKSRNVLVKADGTAAIADFGLAVRYSGETGQLDVAPNTRVGTRRYMAPEVLSETLDPANFDSFKAADIYSLGLVLWEIGRRTINTEKKGDVEEARLPYYDVVPSDPTHQDMFQAVCVKKIRPDLPDRWANSESLRQLGRLIAECVHERADVRPTALRVKKNLSKRLPSTPVPGNPVRMV